MSGMRPRVALLPDMASFLNDVFARIQAAQRRVWVECFIVRDDELGRALGDALVDAASRGVDTRLLIDPLGCRATSSAFFDGLRARGLNVRVYGHIGALLGRFQPKARNHSRILVVDDAAFTGGHAWGREWLPAERGGEGWHDVSCRVDGPIVDDVGRLFAQRWEEALGGRRIGDFDTGNRHGLVRVVSDAPTMKSLLFAEHLRVFGRAVKRIWIANAYCFPPRAMVRALAAAARRGVDVRLVVPGLTDIPLIRRAARDEYDDWLRAGVRVYEFQPTVLHAKYAVVDDDWAVVGSMNANVGSVALSIEIAVISAVPGFVREVARLHQRDQARSVRMTRRSLRGRSWRDRLLDRLSHGVMTVADVALDPCPFRTSRP